MAQMLHEGGLLPQGAIVIHPYDRDAAASEIGQQHELTRLIHGKIASARSAGGNGIEEAQLTRRVIDGKSTHVRCVVEWRPQGERIFRDRIQKSMIGMNREKRGIRDLSGQLRLAHFPGCGMEPADIDPFAVALSNSDGGAVAYELEAGVGAEVHKEIVAGLGLTSRRGKSKGEKDPFSFFGRNHRVSPVVTLREPGEVQKLHRRVAIVNVGVDGDCIRPQHVSHPGLLHAQLRT